MPSYHAARASTRPFIVTPYRPDPRGQMVPDRPDACPWAATGETCSLAVEHWRDRRTGPRHPLLVLRCGDHDHAFTLYPCGHVPYGRSAVAPVREDGALHSPPDWAASIFSAVLDAGDDHLWPADSPADDPRRRRTQLRWLERCEALLGLRSPAALAIAEAIGLAALDVLDARRKLDDTVRTVHRGAIASRLLDAVGPRPGALDAILASGALAGEWGPPIRWEPAHCRRRFLLPRTAAPP